MNATEFLKLWTLNDPEDAIKEFDAALPTSFKTLLIRFAEAYLAHRQAEQSPRCPKCGGVLGPVLIKNSIQNEGECAAVVSCMGICQVEYELDQASDFAQFFQQPQQWIPCSEKEEIVRQAAAAVCEHCKNNYFVAYNAADRDMPWLGWTHPAVPNEIGPACKAAAIWQHFKQPLPSPPKQKG